MGAPASQRRGIHLKPLPGAILHLPHCHMSEPPSTGNKFSLSIDSNEMPTLLGMPPHQPSTIDKAPLTDACGLLVSTHYVIQRIEYNTPNATYLKSLSDH